MQADKDPASEQMKFFYCTLHIIIKDDPLEKKNRC